MGRSTTFSDGTPERYNSTSKDHAPFRSATAQVPEPAKQHHSIHMPHPFHRNAPATTDLPTGRQNRPGIPRRQNSVQTRYMDMLLHLDAIPRLHNIYAAFFSWILLAGFVIFPGTFTSFSGRFDEDLPEGSSAHDFLDRVQHSYLLYIGGFLSGIGAIGMIWLWYRWRANYVWLLNRIFLPGCLNSLAGLLSTLVNVYSQQKGTWSLTAIVTGGVTGGCMVCLAVLFALYNFWILKKVQKSHRRDMESSGAEDEGLVEKIGRKANEPALEPGSVV